MRQRRRLPERGVTLIELMIAVTLVTLLSTGMLMAIRLGMSTMERVNDRLYGNRRVMSVNKIIDSEIAGLVQTKTDCLASGAPGGSISFFQGEQQTMRFVSTYSLDDAARGYPKILEFQVIPGEQSGVRLIVNEMIYVGPPSTGPLCFGLKGNPLLGGQQAPVFVPVQSGPRSFVLADKLAACQISYRQSLPDPPYERWLPVWGNPTLPTAIRIEMTPLPTDKLRLPLVTVIAPVHVNKDPRIDYNAN